MADIPASLVSYESPLLLKESEEKDFSEIPNYESKDGSILQKLDKAKKDSTTSGNAQIDEILDSILPPRTWKQDDGSEWMQYTSKLPATRLDVINLQEKLDSKIVERQARDTGICPVREDLYKQCFDEIIRQVVLNQPERGLLLMRIRDEVRMTTDAYKTLYDSSVVFGIKKHIEAEQGMSDLEERIAALEEECNSKKNKVLELRNKVDIIEKRNGEVRSLMEKKRKEEIDFLKYQGQNLDSFLKSISGGSGS